MEGHTANQWRSRDVNPYLSFSKAQADILLQDKPTPRHNVIGLIIPKLMGIRILSGSVVSACSQTSNIGITWEVVRTINSWVPP